MKQSVAGESNGALVSRIILRGHFALFLILQLTFLPIESRAQLYNLQKQAFETHLSGATTNDASGRALVNDLPSIHSWEGMSPMRIAEVLDRLKPDPPVRSRGIKDVSIYRSVSPSVVLIATDSGIGSGSLLNARGDIITNWHVINGATSIGVVFKPKLEGAKLSRADLRVAKLVKVDEVADLALIRVTEIPAGSEPIRLGDSAEASIGSDVHAIGHPTGEAWTYTRGVISQIRREYSWTSQESNKKHQADVIQTQTPINPGNSGGPLISDSGKLIGVNSFKSQGEGLNFAVSVDEVRRFLLRPESRSAEARSTANNGKSAGSCEGKELFRGRNNKDSAALVTLDLNCNGVADADIIIPDDKDSATLARYDRNEDGKPDVVIFDTDRDGKWDFSFWDNNYDGAWDLVGYHPDGKLSASRFEKYNDAMAKSSK